MRLGTAVWREGPQERRALVAPHPADPGRVVDLNRVEQVRLNKLGEGRAEELAAVLAPPSLRRVLEHGSRSLHRLRQTLAYAEKWQRRSGLPDFLAPALNAAALLPCLPQPALARHASGAHLDRLRVSGPGSTLRSAPQPTLAAIGQHGGGIAGYCLALEDGGSLVLGAWMVTDFPEAGEMEIRAHGEPSGSLPLDCWEGLELPALRAGEVVLLPSPRIKGLPEAGSQAPFEIRTPFESLSLRLARPDVHPTIQ